jgi:hypothetical protein
MPDEPKPKRSQQRRRVEPISASVPLGPEDETLVPCPVCRRGLVAPEVAARIAELLRCEHDGPGEESD